jgi:hypothetical protein
MAIRLGLLLLLCVGISNAQVVPYPTGYLAVTALDVNPRNSGTVNNTNMAAHIAACVTAGGCIIHLGSYTSPILFNNSSGCAITLGVQNSTTNTVADTPYNAIWIQGQGYTINQSTDRATSGTVLQGSSTSNPLICYNPTDASADLSTGNFTASYLTGGGIESLALDTCSTCIKFGALSKPSLSFYTLRHIYISNFSQWGSWIENFQYINVDDFVTQADISAATGQQMWAASSGAAINPGNSTLKRIFAQQYNFPGPERGIVFKARTSAGGAITDVNDINVYDLQSNVGNFSSPFNITQAGTWASGTTISLAANIQDFPVDMPVSVTATAGGFNINQTYFVVSNSGGTGSGTITLANCEGCAALTPSAGMTLITYGYPALEVVGYGSASCANNCVQPSHFDGLDLESNYTSAVVCQAGNADFQMDDIGSGQGVTQISGFVARGCTAIVRSPSEIIPDLDSTSAAQLQMYTSLATDSYGTNAVIGSSPGGFMIDRAMSAMGVGFSGAIRSGLASSVGLVAAFPIPFQSILFPTFSVAQRAIDTSAFNGNTTLNGQITGSVVLDGQNAAHVFTLATLSSSRVNTGTATPAMGTLTSGIQWEVFNDQNFAHTIAASSSSGNFDNNASLASINIPQGGAANIRAQSDNSTGFPVIQSLGPNTTVTATITISGCGSASSVGGAMNAGGFSGTFTCGTGASPATVTVTFPLNAPHYWICNADDITTGPTHLPNSGAAAQATCIFKGNITTSDIVILQATPY